MNDHPTLKSRSQDGARESQLRPARRRTLTDEIIDQLLILIAEGDLPTSRLPPERVLCEQLAVSRAALREAVSALTQVGVLESRGQAKYGSPIRAQTQLLARKKGGVPDEEQSGKAFETRRMLEPQVAALAAKRAQPEDVAEIERWVVRMEEAADESDEVVELDVAFHGAVARATKNDVVMRVVNALNDAARDERAASYRAPGGVEVARAGHRSILEAIQAGDATRARRAMERHLRESERLLDAQ